MEYHYEKQAMEGKPLPPGLNRSDEWMFVMLRELYHQLFSGVVNKETAMADKRKLESEYNKRVCADRFADRRAAHSAALWKRIELYSNTYQRDRTLENADRLIGAIYGVGFPREESTPCQPNA